MMNLGSCFMNSPSCIIHHIPGGRGGRGEGEGRGREGLTSGGNESMDDEEER